MVSPAAEQQCAILSPSRASGGFPIAYAIPLSLLTQITYLGD